MKEALSAAYQNNPTLLAERAQLRAVDEHVARALSGWRPTAQIVADARSQSSSVSEAPGGRPNPYAVGNHSYFAGDYGVAVKQPIYRGGQTVAETAQAAAEVDAERAHLASVEQSVLLAVATDYFDVVIDQSLVALAVQNEHATASEADRVQQMYKGGAVTATDTAEASTAAIEAKAIRRRAIAALDLARTNFKRDTGLAAQELKAQELQAAAFPLALPTDRDQALEQGAATNPDLLTAVNAAKAGDQAIDVARAALLPTVSLIGSVGHRDNYPFERRREDSAAIGIELTIPLYDAGVSHSQVREAKQLHGVLERKTDAARVAVAAAATSAWDRLQAATDDTLLARKASEGSAAIVDGMQREFAIGKRSVRELFDALKDLQKARTAYLQAEHDEAEARFVLAFTVGQLSARQLQLPVQYYDPAVHFKAVRDRWFGTGDQP